MIYWTETGFSIGLKDWELEDTNEMYCGLDGCKKWFKIIDANFDHLAIVKNPSHNELSIANEDELTLTSPVLIPDIKIYREAGFYVSFTKEVIEKLKRQFEVNGSLIIHNH